MAIREASPLGHHSTLPADGGRRVPSMSQASGPPEPPKPRLLDRVRHAIETRHYSRRTEKAYIHWIKRYIFFHGKRRQRKDECPSAQADQCTVIYGTTQSDIAVQDTKR